MQMKFVINFLLFETKIRIIETTRTLRHSLPPVFSPGCPGNFKLCTFADEVNVAMEVVLVKEIHDKGNSTEETVAKLRD